LLTIGDAVVGLVWVYKLDKVKLNLRPLLTRDFISKYSRDESFTRTWNTIQAEQHCCGVDGPLDYENLSQAQYHQFKHSRQSSSSSLKVDVESSLLSLPESCCIVIYDSSTLSAGGGLGDGLNQTARRDHHTFEKELSVSSNESNYFRGGGDRDWDNRQNDNVTNEFTFGERESGSVGYTSSVNNGQQFDYDNSLLNDAPSLDSDEVEKSVPNTDNILKGDKVVVPSVFKHKLRHATHRFKIPSSITNLTLVNDTRLVQAAALSGGESRIEIKNKTKVKAKAAKLFPSFALPKNHIQTTTTTSAPDYADKLPVPFTCLKHPRVERKQNNSPQSNLDDKTMTSFNNKNNQRSDSFETEIGEEEEATALSSSAAAAGKVEEGGDFTKEKESKEVEMDEKNNYKQDLQEQKYPQTRKKSRNRRKRNNPDSILSDSKTQASNFQTVVDSNVFSFLHSPAFKNTRNEDNENSFGEIKRPGATANEIQAAYYFSSLYQSDSFNSSMVKRFQVYRHGCGVKMLQWVDHVSGLLFILGFCIIGFVKVSFLVILRTEIREMIEKIQLLELEDPVSPTRAQQKDQRLYVSHPLLAHPHRASTVSAHAFAAAMPTIKSPEGTTVPTRFPKSYNQRRHSNIIGDRSSAHSQETVNMTLLVTNNPTSGCSKAEPKQEKGRSNPNLSNFLIRDDFDPISIYVPNTAKYLRRNSTASTSAHMNPSYSYLQYDENRPGPSSRLCHHQHCIHNHHATKPRLYTRNMSIGAVVHHNISSAGPSASGAATAFRSFGGESGSGNCSFSSRDENEILSASMDNVAEDRSELAQSDEEKEKERRDAEIRNWAAATACTDLHPIDGSCDDVATPTPTALSLLDYTKVGFNHSSDSESNDRNSGGRRNGNNNVDVESIPLSYRGTAV
jgi:hypothetical protein